MADSHTGRLCVQIINSHFGPITAVSRRSFYNISEPSRRDPRQSVASALLTRGRLPLPQLVRITGHKPRTVTGAVLALVQHNLLWHARTEEDGEVLEVNVDECLMRLRFGRFVWQAEELWGKPVCNALLTYVYCRIISICRQRRSFRSYLIMGNFDLLTFYRI